MSTLKNACIATVFGRSGIYNPLLQSERPNFNSPGLRILFELFFQCCLSKMQGCMSFTVVHAFLALILSNFAWSLNILSNQVLVTLPSGWGTCFDSCCYNAWANGRGRAWCEAERDYYLTCWVTENIRCSSFQTQLYFHISRSCLGTFLLLFFKARQVSIILRPDAELNYDSNFSM